MAHRVLAAPRQYKTINFFPFYTFTLRIVVPPRCRVTLQPGLNGSNNISFLRLQGAPAFFLNPTAAEILFVSCLSFMPKWGIQINREGICYFSAPDVQICACARDDEKQKDCSKWRGCRYRRIIVRSFSNKKSFAHILTKTELVDIFFVFVEYTIFAVTKILSLFLINIKRKTWGTQKAFRLS